MRAHMRAHPSSVNRAVLRDKLRCQSLIDGTVDLIDIALLNDALNVAAENDSRMGEASRGR